MILAGLMISLGFVNVAEGKITRRHDNGAIPLNDEWDDGPEKEDSPMNYSYPGNPLVEISVSYEANHLSSTKKGVILLELFENWAPITVGNFVGLVEQKFYDNTIFHRNIDDFVIQGGDPDADDPNNDGTGEPIVLEIHPKLTHVDGALGMARESDPDTAESQFYITDGEEHRLDDSERKNATPPDRGYAVFGVVRDGMSHVRALACVPTSRAPLGCEYPENNADQPARPLVDTDVKVIRVVGQIPYPPEEEDELPLLPILVVATLGVAVLVFATTDLKELIKRRDDPLVAEQPHEDKGWK